MRACEILGKLSTPTPYADENNKILLLLISFYLQYVINYKLSFVQVFHIHFIWGYDYFANEGNAYIILEYFLMVTFLFS